MTPSESTPAEAAAALREILRLLRQNKPVPPELLCQAAPSQNPRQREQLLISLNRAEHARRLASSSDVAAALTQDSEPTVPGYEILRPIAGGGQGNVHQARRLSDGAIVAIKFLHGGALARPSDRERFAREAAILAELRHPNVVSVIESGQTESGAHYLVMPYIEGEPLHVARLFRERSDDDRLRLFVKVCRAVQAAHARGIVHRDLKPNNVRIDRNGQPHVVDFGLASESSIQAAESLRMTGHPLGTFMWSSYEQVRGDTLISAASDVYSLGVILHQLMTGGQFPGQVLETLRLAVEPVIDGTPAGIGRIAGVTSTLRTDLKAIVDRCLNTDPRRRYSSAGELADAVERIIGTRPPLKPGNRAIKYWIIISIAATCLAVWLLRTDTRRIYRFHEPVNGRNREVVLGQYFVWIPPGEFMFGDAEGRSHPDELPPRRVTIPRGFYMLTTEVTQAFYRDVMGTNPARFVGDELPVERVSYHDATEFCRRASTRTGRRIRLPTEIEWEYACRAGTTTRYFFGGKENIALFLRYGNLADRSTAAKFKVGAYRNWDDGNPATALASTFAPNKWELVDMLGNVWEWCAAPYCTDALDPSTASATLAPARGGSWWDGPDSARCGTRNPLQVDIKEDTLGFRVVFDDPTENPRSNTN